MHLTKLMFAAALFTPIGFFALAGHASVGPSVVQVRRGANARYIVIAGEVEDKAQGKVNEMHDMGSGAANAVEEKHEEHEASEATTHHHGLKHKAKSKMSEVKGEANGAADAVENAHHEHEQAEHE